MEEAKEIDDKAEFEEDNVEAEELVEHEAVARLPEGLLHFSDSEDKEVKLPK